MMKPEVKLFIEKYHQICGAIANGRNYPLLFSLDEAQNYESAGFIDFNEGIYQYGSCERGICKINFFSADQSECLFYPIEFAVSQLAFDYELQHRIENQDSRILAFTTMVQYMRKINLDWANKLEVELSNVLLRSGLSINM